MKKTLGVIASSFPVSTQPIFAMSTVGGRVFTSKNGSSWSRVTTPNITEGSSLNLSGIISKAIISSPNNNRASEPWLYTEDFINFLNGTRSESNAVYFKPNLIGTRVFFNNNMFFVYTDGTTYYSSDGLNWSYTSGSYIRQARYLNGKHVSFKNSYIHFSDDGINWTQLSGSPGTFYSGSPSNQMAFYDNKYIFLNASTSKVYFVDPETLVITENDMTGLGNSYNSSIWDCQNGVLIAEGTNESSLPYQPGEVHYSTDYGITWTQTSQTFSLSPSFMTIAVSNGKILLIAYSERKSYMSNDGISWQEGSIPIDVSYSNQNSNNVLSLIGILP